jgi:dihydrofolate reductase
MNIILAMVISVDGKSTKHDLPDQSWASREDSKHLSKLISENNLILMGGKTYETAKSHIKPSEGKLRIIVTHNPEKFADDAVEGQLEFSNKELSELVKSLEDRGFKQMLLLSGEHLNKEFFEANLIDEVYLTVEPKIFGSGRGILTEANLDIQLELLDMEKLNEQGTILLRYKVVK